MIVRGTWDWNLVKIETDAGLYGIGEAYWGAGVKDVILNIMKHHLIGEDPLNVDKLYTTVLMRNAGAGAIAGITVTAATALRLPSGIWLAGFWRHRSAISSAGASATACASTAPCRTRPM